MKDQFTEPSDHYDFDRSSEIGELLTTLASMWTAAHYGLGETDADERRRISAHIDRLYVRAVDDSRFAITQAAIDARKAGEADAQKEAEENIRKQRGAVLVALHQLQCALFMPNADGSIGPRRRTDRAAAKDLSRALVSLAQKIVAIGGST